MLLREDIAGDVLASITTMQWNGPAKGWDAGAPMDDANFNRRRTIRVGASVAYAQLGVIGFDGPIDLQSLRLYKLPEAAPAVLNGTPLLTGALFGSGRREFAAEVSGDLPSLAPGPTIMWRSLFGLAELLARLRAATRRALLPMNAWLMCGDRMLSCCHPQ